MENAESEGRREVRDRLKYFREHGKINMTDPGWSNDETHRQPDREKYPTPITPTDSGYPGLEPPIG